MVMTWETKETRVKHRILVFFGLRFGHILYLYYSALLWFCKPWFILLLCIIKAELPRFLFKHIGSACNTWRVIIVSSANLYFSSVCCKTPELISLACSTISWYVACLISWVYCFVLYSRKKWKIFNSCFVHCITWISYLLRSLYLN